MRNNLSAANKVLGFSLVELMVAITISLFIVFMVTNIFIATQQVSNAQAYHAQMQDNARTALALIGRMVRQAGYCDAASYSQDASANWVTPCNNMTPAIMASAIHAVPVANFATNYNLATGQTANLGILISSKNNQSDILTLSFIVGPQASSNAALPDCLGETSMPSNTLVTNTFYIDVETVGSVGNIQTIRPALFCQVKWTDPTGLDITPVAAKVKTNQLIAENIERIQVLLGVDTNSDGTPDSFVPPSSAVDMSQLYLIRVALLARQDPVYNLPRVEANNGQPFNLFGNRYASVAISTDSSWVQPLASGSVACTQSTPCWARRVFESTFVLRNRAL